jgi:hypothetical protein
MHRNRVKSDRGDHWLRVPVWRTGRDMQVIGDVEICQERSWREEVYSRGIRTLLALNLDLIRYLARNPRDAVSAVGARRYRQRHLAAGERL